MSGVLSVHHHVPDGYYHPDVFQVDGLRAAYLERARREDQRLVDLVARVADLPFPLHVYQNPEQHMLEVRARGVRLSAITSETMRHLPSVDAAAVKLGQLTRQGWFAFEPLPVPDNVVVGDN